MRRTESPARELDVEVTRFDDSAAAVSDLQSSKEYRAEEGTVATELRLGDEGIRYPFDGSIEGAESLGVSVEVRIDNLVLDVSFDQSKSLGTPDAEQVEALAEDLVREIQSRQPSR